MVDATKTAYEFALELAKQLITLSTAITTVTIALTKDVFSVAPSVAARSLLVLAWGCYLRSVWCGVQHIQSLTGSLEWSALEDAASADDSLRVRGIAASAQRYLRAVGDSSVSTTARDQMRWSLSEKGVFVGTSAKEDADRQIFWFFAGTFLTVVYGTVLLATRRPKKTPVDTGP